MANNTRAPVQNPTAVRDVTPNALKGIPYVGHTSEAESWIPIYAPARDGIAYLQDGDYKSAAVSLAQLGLDATALVPGGAALLLARQAMKAEVRGAAELSTNQIRGDLKKAGLIKPGDHLHHIWARNGMDYTTKSYRNHPAFLRIAPEAKHQRLHGQWKGEPRYNAVERLWHGSNTGMKAAAAGSAAAGSRAAPQTEIDRRRR